MPASSKARTIVVGAGQSGYVVATTLRKLEPDRALAVFGDEPHAPYERPPLSKDVLLDPAAALPAFLPAAEYGARGIELNTGARVCRIDREAKRIVLGDGVEHCYDTLILTTGSRPVVLALEGAEHLRYLRSFEDALHIRSLLSPGSKLVMIGAGVIGLELAAAARARGAEVTMVEASDSVMGRGLPAPERDFLQGLHEEQGVRFRFGTTVTAVRRETMGRLEVTLSDGDRIPADLVVAGVGVVRNDELARQSGLAVDRGVVVDEFGRTSDESVYCAGDVAAFWHPVYERRLRLESWHHALEHASAVAHAVVDKATRYAPVPRFWTDQYGLNIQVVGEHADAVSVAVEGSRTERKFTATYLDREERIVFAACVNDARRVRPFLKSIAGREPAPPAIAALAQPIRGEHHG